MLLGQLDSHMQINEFRLLLPTLKNETNKKLKMNQGPTTIWKSLEHRQKYDIKNMIIEKKYTEFKIQNFCSSKGTISNRMGENVQDGYI